MKFVLFIRSTAVVMLLVVMSLTSCVQSDMYDGFFDDDLSSGEMIARRKYKNDYGQGPDFDLMFQEIAYAKQWVNDASTLGNSECLALALSSFSGKSLVNVRNEIGRIKYNNSFGWEYSYMTAVEGEGIKPGSGNSERMFKEIAGASVYNNADFENYVRSLSAVLSENGEIRVYLGMKVIVGTGAHWGIINYLVYENGVWSLRVIDQYSETTPLSLSGTMMLLK